MAITYEETVQTVLNLVHEKAQLQARVEELEKELNEIKRANAVRISDVLKEKKGN